MLRKRFGTGNKFGAVRVKLDGFTFASKKEAKRYGELKLLEKAGEIRNLVVHPRYKLELDGVLLCTYVGDFQYQDGMGIVWEDIKGYKNGPAYDLFRLKKNLMAAIAGIEVVEL